MIQSIPVKILRHLLKEVGELLKDHPMYIDRDEFIREAIREKIERIKAGSRNPRNPSELNLEPWIC